MRKLAAIVTFVVAQVLITQLAVAQSKTCRDVDFKPSALERFPEMREACESVVSRDGEDYIKIRAEVRSTRRNQIRLYFPALRQTITVSPRDMTASADVGGEQVAFRDLRQGQEIRIYLPLSEIEEPVIDEVVLVVTEAPIETHPAVQETMTAAMPSTASLWPAVGLLGGLFAFAGVMVGGARRLLRRG